MLPLHISYSIVHCIIFFLLPTVGSLVDTWTYFALYPGGTPSLTTGTSPPSCILLENCLFMNGALPECIDCHFFDLHVVTPLQRFGQFFKSHRMSLNFVDVFLSSKSSVAVHDEGHMSRDLATFQDPKKKWIDPRISKSFFGNPSHCKAGPINLKLVKMKWH